MNLAQFYTSFFQPGKISTDSRNVKPGDIFIALKGDRFDGNQYVKSVLNAGACVAVSDDNSLPTDPKIYKVENSLLFLQRLANYHRKQVSAQIIAITGSNGKTTTKELLYSILARKLKTQATIGNLNNHIGVPLTLLSLASDTHIGIVEMGANHPGEIKMLCEIAEPDMGLITNIGRAHLEGFGSYEGVIRTKSELYDYLRANEGKIFLDLADPVLAKQAGNYAKLLGFNSKHGLRAEIQSNLPTLQIDLLCGEEDKISINTHLFGEYNLQNILAAAAISQSLGLDLTTIKSGIEAYHPDNFRSQVIQVAKSKLILDCYNANPTSMSLALQEFSRIPIKKKKIAILGSMKELGESSEEEHQIIVELAVKLNINHLIFIGEEFQVANIQHGKAYRTADESKSFLESLDLNDSNILIKGSRANQLEKLGEFIQMKLTKPEK